MYDEVVRRRLGPLKCPNFSQYVQGLIKQDIVGATASSVELNESPRENRRGFIKR
jgi:hypothetical protein